MTRVEHRALEVGSKSLPMPIRRRVYYHIPVRWCYLFPDGEKVQQLYWLGTGWVNDEAALGCKKWEIRRRLSDAHAEPGPHPIFLRNWGDWGCTCRTRVAGTRKIQALFNRSAPWLQNLVCLLSPNAPRIIWSSEIWLHTIKGRCSPECCQGPTCCSLPKHHPTTVVGSP